MRKELNIVCTSCSSKDISRIGTIPQSNWFAGRQLERPLESTELYKCNTCHLWFRYPQLAKTELDKLYIQGSVDTWNGDRSINKRTDWEIAKNKINSFLERGKVLDVGCFDGGFLATLGTTYHKFGLEIHLAAANKAKEKGIDILGNDFSQLENYYSSFDVTTAFDVVEHVHNPLTFLQSLSHVTRPGGWVIVSTGNTQSLSWRFMGSGYWYCAIPEHISFINPDWCFYNASRCDLEVKNWQTFSHSERKIFKLLLQTGKNIFYRSFPVVWRWLRKQGFGNVNIISQPTLANIPPGWSMAKDHFIIIFQKQQ